MPMRVAAFVLAAGSSQRFGGDPSSSPTWAGQPFLSARSARSSGWMNRRDVGRHVGRASVRTADLLVDEGIAGVVRGGDSRAESTQLGLAALGS